MVADWYAATSEHPDQDSVMLAHRRADVAELNERARAMLRADGRLGETELEANGRAFAVGDRVVACRNDRANAITNGQRATVANLDEERRSLTLAFDDGRAVEVPAGYIEDGQLDHAYAMTAHRAQGATVDRTFVLGSDDLYREWGYTALSRHREEARFYVNVGGAQAALHAPRPEDPVTGPLTRQRGKRLALDTLNESGLRLQPPTLQEAVEAKMQFGFGLTHELPDSVVEPDDVLGPHLDLGP